MDVHGFGFSWYGFQPVDAVVWTLGDLSMAVDKGFDKRRFVHVLAHGPWFRGFSNAVVVHVHGLRGIAVDPEPWFRGCS